MGCMLMTPKDLKKKKKKKKSFTSKKISLSSQNKFHHTLLSSHLQKVLNISRSQILDSHKNWHTITCTKFNKDLLVVCATSKCMSYPKGDVDGK